MTESRQATPGQLAAACDIGRMLLHRSWFKGVVSTAEGTALPALFLEIYEQNQLGLLLSKTDAAKAIGAESKITARRYIERAEKMGIVRIVRSERDRRIELLVPTERGIALIEDELRRIVKEMDWAQAMLRSDVTAADSILPDMAAYTRHPDHLIEPPSLELVDASAPPQGAGEDPDSYHYRAEAESMVSALSETLRILPNHSRARRWRAHYLYDLGRRREALEDVEEVWKSPPIGDKGFFRLSAKIYEENGDLGKALRSLDQAVDVEPDDLWLRRARAVLHDKANNQDKAILDQTEAINIGLSQGAFEWMCYFDRANLHAKYGNFSAARADYVAALDKAGPDSPVRKLLSDKIDKIDAKLRDGAGGGNAVPILKAADQVPRPVKPRRKN